MEAGAARIGFDEARKHRLLSGAGKWVFYSLTLAYVVGPPLVVPLLAYRPGNWWFLFGVFAAYAGAVSASRSSALMAMATLFAAVVWFRAGFSVHQYLKFFYLCGLAGFLLYWLADAVETIVAIATVRRDEAMYAAAIEAGVLFVTLTVPKQ